MICGIRDGVPSAGSRAARALGGCTCRAAVAAAAGRAAASDADDMPRHRGMPTPLEVYMSCPHTASPGGRIRKTLHPCAAMRRRWQPDRRRCRPGDARGDSRSGRRASSFDSARVRTVHGRCTLLWGENPFSCSVLTIVCKKFPNDVTNPNLMLLCVPRRARSSVGESTWLRTKGSWVRILPGAPPIQGPEF